jgi:hypothetical protein
MYEMDGNISFETAPAGGETEKTPGSEAVSLNSATGRVGSFIHKTAQGSLEGTPKAEPDLAKFIFALLK